MFLQKGENMGEDAKSKDDIKYYQNKIIHTISMCSDLNVLSYLEKFNRLYVEKYCKKEE